MKKIYRRLNQVPSHKFRNTVYHIAWKSIPMGKGSPKGEKWFGACQSPTDAKGNPRKKPRIVIDPKQNDLDLLQTIIDESIHACMFDLDNFAVEEMSLAIATMLSRCGYSLPTSSEKTQIGSVRKS